MTQVDLRLRRDLARQIRKDLARTHAYAFERVGFVLCRRAKLPDGIMLIAESYMPVADEDYVFQQRYGATINANAFRKAMQHALADKVSVLHVHAHDHEGRPRYSRDDTDQSALFIPDFWNVLPGVPHGTLLVSRDEAIGLAWVPGACNPQPMRSVAEIGFPLATFWK